MNRKNRISYKKLTFGATSMIESVLRLCRFKNVNIATGIQTAMLKLVDKEFLSH